MSDDRQQTSDEWTAMVKQREHRAKLEQVAREFIDQAFEVAWGHNVPPKKERLAETLVALLASQRAAVLEEIIPLMTKLQEINDEAVTSSDRYWVKVGIADILKKLQERRP